MAKILYILADKALKKWSGGAMAAQIAHAALALVAVHGDRQSIRDYLSNPETMHKVVLQVKGPQELISIQHKLEQNGIVSYLWVEQPEDVAVALAIEPLEKEAVFPFLGSLRLFA